MDIFYIYNIALQKVILKTKNREVVKATIEVDDFVLGKVYKKIFAVKTYNKFKEYGMSFDDRINALLAESRLTKTNLKELSLFELETFHKQLKFFGIAEEEWYDLINEKLERITLYGTGERPRRVKINKSSRGINS